jgi:hypothetical protein
MLISFALYLNVLTQEMPILIINVTIFVIIDTGPHTQTVQRIGIVCVLRDSKTGSYTSVLHSVPRYC